MCHNEISPKKYIKILKKIYKNSNQNNTNRFNLKKSEQGDPEPT